MEKVTRSSEKEKDINTLDGEIIEDKNKKDDNSIILYFPMFSYVFL